MTIEYLGDLIDALKARLEEALTAKGVPEADGEAAPNVPVFTNITAQKHRLYLRLEGFSMHQGNSVVGHSDRHTFLVRVVHEQMGRKITKPASQIARIEGLVKAALKDWSPLPSATIPHFVSSFEAEDPKPEVTTRVSRYQLYVNGD